MSSPSQKMSLLVRNLRYETSPDKVREFFERFGEIRDVYLPLDYHTKRPRGFGFVEFYDDRDAREALQRVNGEILDGSEVSVTVAQEGRKTPEIMRVREKDPDEVRRGSTRQSRSRSGSRHRSDRRRGPPSHRGRRSYSRSPSPVMRRRGAPYSGRRRSYSPRRSPKYSRSVSRSCSRDRNPRRSGRMNNNRYGGGRNDRYRMDERERDRSPRRRPSISPRNRSPIRDRGRSRSRTPASVHLPSREGSLRDGRDGSNVGRGDSQDNPRGRDVSPRGRSPDEERERRASVSDGGADGEGDRDRSAGSSPAPRDRDGDSKRSATPPSKTDRDISSGDDT